MCGIGGVVSLRPAAPVELDALGRMAGALRHRGPDEAGLYRDGWAGLAHTRLSIIDLRSGQQPLCNEDGTLWVAFNGEIYNHLELRAELEALGHRFRTRSDTEAIVHAFEAWGEGAFPRFNGQFAIALWDARRRRLTLARDRLGVRPLYLREEPGRVIFASEVKALFALDPSIPRALDPLGLQQAFTFWGVIPPRTAFRGVSQLEPGHVRSYEKGDLRDRAFWTPRFPEGRDGEFRGSAGEAAEAVRAALTRATSLRMLRADVPVGSYLSGGLDSSLVAAMGLRAKGERFRTFSVRFEDPEYDETPWQRKMVQQLGSEHFEVMVTRGDVAEALPGVVRHAEQPILRTAPAPLFLLSRLVREQGIKVVLTGEGADEMFAGYDLFREARVRRFWARAPSSKLRPLLLDRLYPWLARSPVAQREMARAFFGKELSRAGAPGFSHGLRWSTTSALQRLFSADLRRALQGRDAAAEYLDTLPAEFRRWSPLAQDQYLEIATLLSPYLLCAQGDRMLMAHSVEGRFPFLDPEVIDLAASLPPRFKLSGLQEKQVLKNAARGLVPDDLIARKKQPYRAPDALAFTGAQAPAWASEALDEPSLREAGVFDPALAARLWRKCRSAQAQLSNSDNMALAGVLSTQLLFRELVRRPPLAHVPERFATLVDRAGG